MRERGAEKRPRPRRLELPETSRVRHILERIREIPRGQVRTYGEIDPGAPRFVGFVLARTTEELPWHRVIRANGQAPMGERQLRRLRREGVPIRGVRVDLRLAKLCDSKLRGTAVPHPQAIRSTPANDLKATGSGDRPGGRTLSC
ncbi:MAG TPA: MGMT family protein [Thermoplasmata archaeon]|nr:MGMT family protein [Thermoplasmata archaeon]